MSSPADAVVSLIRRLAPSDLDVFTAQEQEVRQKVQGTMVSQRNTASAPDIVSDTDMLYFDILTRGEGGGGLDSGRARAAAYGRSLQIYRALRLVQDTEAEGNRIISVVPDSAPVEIRSQVGTYDFQFGIQVLRYLGD